MDYNKFKEYIKWTPVLSDNFKESLLEEAKSFEPELLRQILISVYNSELDFVEKADEFIKEGDRKQMEAIQKEENAEKQEAEEEINKILNS